MYRNIAETIQKPKTELSSKTANGFNPLAILAKKPHRRCRTGSIYASTSTLMYINISGPAVEIFFI